MSDNIDPLALTSSSASMAAHQVVVEMIRAGQIKLPADAANYFTFMLNHYNSERKRISEQKKA